MHDVVGAIIEARMASSRLPGKVMNFSNSEATPLIKIMVDRVKKSVLLDKIVVATTKDKSDDEFCSYMDTEGIKYYRGSVDNVLERVSQAARVYGIDTIVELTGDCPLIDPSIIDLSIGYYYKMSLRSSGRVYVGNTAISPIYPRGQDVSVFSFDILKTCSNLTVDDMENVSYYFYSRPIEYLCCQLPSNGLNFAYCQRLTVDYPEDLKLINAIIEELGPDCSISQIIELLEDEEDIRALNCEFWEKKYVNDKFRRGPN